jgi:hypothetical protein
MQTKPFEIWWQEFLASFPDRWTSGNEVSESLTKLIEGLPDSERVGLLNDLLKVVLQKNRAWRIAAGTLSNCASTTQRQAIVDHLLVNKIVSSDGILSAQFIGNIQYQTVAERYKARDYDLSLLRILAGDETGEFIPLIEQYLNTSIVEGGYESVCWQLWKHHSILAVKGWVRFFAYDPIRTETHNMVIQAFQKNTRALNAFKKEMRSQYPDLWKAFYNTIQAPDMIRWLNEEEKEQLFLTLNNSAA